MDLASLVRTEGTRHRYTIVRLDRALAKALGDRALVLTQMPFAASDDSEPEPDLSVVPPGDWLDGHPDRAWLVVEVTESSHRRDLVTKAALYAASGVSEYWVIDLVSRTLVCHTVPENGRYGTIRTIDDAGTISLAAFLDVSVNISGILPPR